MSGTDCAVQAWLDALKECTTELATSTLGLDGMEVVGTREQVPHGTAGAYITLVTDREPVVVTLAAEQQASESLARTFLCMEPEEELSAEDTRDATGELVNILAGAVKSQMASQYGSIQLGLPTFVQGHILATQNQSMEIVEVQLGTATAYLAVLRGS